MGQVGVDEWDVVSRPVHALADGCDGTSVEPFHKPLNTMLLECSRKPMSTAGPSHLQHVEWVQ